MSTFTPTHRVKSAPFYRSTALGTRRPNNEVKIGDLVRIDPADKIDSVGDYFVTREHDYAVYLNEECLEALTPEPATDAATIKRDVLVSALVDNGMTQPLADLIADAAEHRSR